MAVLALGREVVGRSLLPRAEPLACREACLELLEEGRGFVHLKAVGLASRCIAGLVRRAGWGADLGSGLAGASSLSHTAAHAWVKDSELRVGLSLALTHRRGLPPGRLDPSVVTSIEARALKLTTALSFLMAE